jgi:glycosyltransferase involved in cell wall biosynthesis
LLTPYLSNNEYIQTYNNLEHNRKIQQLYGENLFEEVFRYANVASNIVLEKDFDVIHAHDWLTAPAGIKAKELTGKPLVLHVHATEIDRTGGLVNQAIYDIEREATAQADKIIAVSNHTKKVLIEHYGVSQDKIEVVHNGVDKKNLNLTKNDSNLSQELKKLKSLGYQLVLFVGRLTRQKGVDYLLKAAKDIIQKNPKTLFIFSGSGDMERQLIQQTAELEVSENVIFTGWLGKEGLKSLYQMADLFVMPSVSEPFGLVAAEAALHKTPVILSRTSGAMEVLKSTLATEFWDTDKLSNLIFHVLKYKGLKKTLAKKVYKEAKILSWDSSARKIVRIYENLIF